VNSGRNFGTKKGGLMRKLQRKLILIVAEILARPGWINANNSWGKLVGSNGIGRTQNVLPDFGAMVRATSTDFECPTTSAEA
jgi:hypothetical protein